MIYLFNENRKNFFVTRLAQSEKHRIINSGVADMILGLGEISLVTIDQGH
jgi:hypothetical protein